MFKCLTMTVKSTGESITMRDERGFQNFDLLHEMLGDKKYIDLNDDLMDGNAGDRYEYKIYENGELVEVLIFEYA